MAAMCTLLSLQGLPSKDGQVIPLAGCVPRRFARPFLNLTLLPSLAPPLDCMCHCACSCLLCVVSMHMAMVCATLTLHAGQPPATVTASAQACTSLEKGLDICLALL